MRNGHAPQRPPRDAGRGSVEVGGPEPRVLRLIARLNTGGAAAPLLMQGIHGLPGYSQVLVAGVPEENEVEMESLLGRMKNPVTYLEDLRRSISLPSDFRAVRKLVELYQRVEPDIIETHTAKAGLVGRIAAAEYNRRRRSERRTPAKVAHFFHGHIFRGDYFSSHKTRFFLQLERALARHATDMIWTPCQQQVDELAGEFRIGARSQYRVIRYGIEIDQLTRGQATNRQEFRSELGLGEDDVLIGLIGRLEAVKDPMMFLRGAANALDRLADESIGSRCRYVVIGDGTLRPELESEAARLGLQDRIQFLGTRQDRERFLAGVDVVALTSLNEGYPVALIEAMAFGKPVIGTGVGGVKELVRPEETGLLIDVGDHEMLGAAIAALLRDPPRMRRLGAGGRAFVQSSHDVVHMISDTQNAFAELLYGSREIREPADSA